MKTVMLVFSLVTFIFLSGAADAGAITAKNETKKVSVGIDQPKEGMHFDVYAADIELGQPHDYTLWMTVEHGKTNFMMYPASAITHIKLSTNIGCGSRAWRGYPTKIFTIKKKDQVAWKSWEVIIKGDACTWQEKTKLRAK